MATPGHVCSEGVIELLVLMLLIKLLCLLLCQHQLLLIGYLKTSLSYLLYYGTCRPGERGY